MLTPNQIIKSIVHYGIIAEYLAINDHVKAIGSFCKVSAYQHVLQLPYHVQCKGLTNEELNIYCKEKAFFYNKLHIVGYSLQDFFTLLDNDLEEFYTKYKINLK